MRDSKQILTADEKHHVRVFDPDKFMQLHRAYYLNLKAQSPTETELYRVSDEEVLRNRIHASLRPHDVTFFDRDTATNHCYVTKDPYATELKGGAGLSSMIGAVLSGWKGLQLLFKHPGLNGPGGPQVGG